MKNQEIVMFQVQEILPSGKESSATLVIIKRTSRMHNERFHVFDEEIIVIFHPFQSKEWLK